MRVAFVANYSPVIKQSFTAGQANVVPFGSPARFGHAQLFPPGQKPQERESDFVPTPGFIIDRMIALADIKPGMRVLEPSAGEGHMARELKKLNVRLDVLELNPFRRKCLTEQGFNVVGDDFLKHDREYDRIIMNPPFSQNQAATHVRHAFQLLKPGGRLVAILPEYYFISKNGSKWEFRKWLHQVSGGSTHTECLPEDSFAPVKVQTRILIVNKPTSGGKRFTTRKGEVVDLNSFRKRSGRTA